MRVRARIAVATLAPLAFGVVAAASSSSGCRGAYDAAPAEDASTDAADAPATDANDAGQGGCVPPLADCDEFPGCETDLTSSAEHCGACGAACTPGHICVAKTCRDPNPKAPASCKAIKEDGGLTDDGVYMIAVGISVYCNMQLNGGGWTLIANVPLGPTGHWEQNALSNVTTTPLIDPSTTGMLLPTRVDALGLAYSEVMFTDTSTNNWFTVASTSAFYLHNYRGECNDPLVIQNGNFAVMSRSSGAGDLNAWWGNDCPNGADSVVAGGQSCGNLFVAFDTRCVADSATRLRAYVR